MDKGPSGARIAALIMIMLMLPSILANLPGNNVQAASGNPWFLKTIATERQAIYGMATGEIDPTCPGEELVVTGGGGLVDEYCSQTFQVKPLFAALQTQHAVAIGHIDSRYPGNQVITVGIDSKVHVLHRESNGGWLGETVWDSKGQMNGVTVGEFNASHVGLELAVALDLSRAAIITQDPKVPGGWAVTVLMVQNETITNMMIYSADVLPDYPGDEIFVGSFSGDLFMIHQYSNNATYNITSIWRNDIAVMGVAYGANANPDVPSPQLYIDDLYGKVSLLYFNGTNWINQTIYQDVDQKPMYGIVPVDVDPRYPGPEVLFDGTSPNLHVSHYIGGKWITENVTDPTGQDRLKLLYTINVGEYDATHHGPEIMLGGFQQDLLAIEYTEPNFQLVPLFTNQTVVSGQDANFWVQVNAVGYFTGQIALSSSAGVAFSETKALPDDLVKVTVRTSPSSTDSNLDITVSGTSLDLGQTKNVTLTVHAKSSTKPGLVLTLLPEVQTTPPGFMTTFIAKATILNSWDLNVEFFLDTELPFATTMNLDNSPLDTPMAVLNVTPSALAVNGTYSFIISCDGTDTHNGTTFEARAVATIIVDASGSPDFSLVASPLYSVGVPNSTLKYTLTLNPLYEFSDQVTISVDGIPTGSKGSFSAMLVDLPTKITYILTLGSSVQLGSTILLFKASGGGQSHTVPTQLTVASPSLYGDYQLSITPPIQMVSPGEKAYFFLHETGSFIPGNLEVQAAGAPFQATLSSGTASNPDYLLLTVSVRSNAALGTYKGLVVGTSPWEHNASFMVVVIAGSSDIDLTVAPKDILTSLGQDWPITYLNATTNLALVNNKTLTYSTLGLGIEGKTDLYNYTLSKALILPIGDLGMGTYLFLLVVKTPDMPYPKVLVGTLTMTRPMALLYVKVAKSGWTFHEGDHNTVQVWATNTGIASSGPLNIEVLLDGVSLCRRTVGPVPAGGKSEPLNCTVPAVAGTHNITYLIELQDTSQGRVIQPSMSEQFKIYGFGWMGPALAIMLLVLVVALLGAVTRMRSEEKPSSTTKMEKPKRKDTEEE